MQGLKIRDTETDQILCGGIDFDITIWITVILCLYDWNFAVCICPGDNGGCGFNDNNAVLITFVGLTCSMQGTPPNKQAGNFVWFKVRKVKEPGADWGMQLNYFLPPFTNCPSVGEHPFLKIAGQVGNLELVDPGHMFIFEI